MARTRVEGSGTTGRLTPRGVAMIAAQYWGTFDDVVTATAIAIAENRTLKVNATNRNSDGSIDRGIWQINSVHKQFDAQRLLSDPVYNGQAAYEVYREAGNSFRPWTTFKKRLHVRHLPKARRAAKAIIGSSGSGKLEADLDLPGFGEPIADAAGAVREGVTGWVGDLGKVLWPVLLGASATGLGLGLVGYGIVKLVGSSGAADVATKTAPVVGQVAKARLA